MDLLLAFIRELPVVGGIVGLAFAICGVTMWGLWRPENTDREVWLRRLEHQDWRRRYAELVGGALDWLDRRWTPELAREDRPFEPNSLRAAFSGRLLDFTLVFALAYPLLSLMLQWSATGEAATVGGAIVFPAEPNPLMRAAAIGGMVIMAFAIFRAQRASRAGYTALWMLAASAVTVAFAITFTFAVAFAVTVTVAFAVTSAVAVAVAGALAVTFAVAFTVAGVVAGVATVALAGVVTFAFAFAVAGVVTVASTVAVDYLRNRTGRSATILFLWASLGAAGFVALVVYSSGIRASDRGIILFIGLLPLLNGLTDFLSTGATRYLLRLAPRLAHPLARLGIWLLDAVVAVSTLALLAGGFIVFVTYAVPQDGVPLADLPALFKDIRDHPENYWWLAFMVFTTLLPSMAHLVAAAYSVVFIVRRSWRVWIAEGLHAGANGAEQRGRTANLVLIVGVSLAWGLPTAALWELASWAWSGSGDLRGWSLDVAEDFARWIAPAAPVASGQSPQTPPCAQGAYPYNRRDPASGSRIRSVQGAPMPKRADIDSVLIIGAGPIVIGQACEFDYSGAQACKALREEGYRVVLVNSNPATIMTDPGMADATYVEPITPEVVARIIEKEQREHPGEKMVLLPTMGGQTGLNTAMSLAGNGTLDRLGIELIGANREAIEMAEDRKLFREAMDRIGLENPKATIAETIEECVAALDHVGLPAIIRPAFTLGGTGGGVAYNREDYLAICKTGLDASPVSQILIDESLLGWKEFEMEVVRDKADNAIIVCSIENVDPMGVHTGDSITVAPALTLTDKEYQMLRNASLAVLREIGVETGGSNVQFAISPETGRIVVIEMNPRVSRSSALASKATGFPIAKIAAKLAVGYTLDELDNDITGVTPASFEPTIDYVVTKIPRFAFEKFPGSAPELTTAMKSVGEAMAIGRSFHESVQKALASMETGLTGFDEIAIDGAPENAPLASRADIEAGGSKTLPGADAVTQEAVDKGVTTALAKRTPDRLRVVAQAMRYGFTDEEINEITAFDPWFLARVREIVAMEEAIREDGLPVTVEGMRAVKMMGFTDARLAALTGLTETEVRAARTRLGVVAVFKRIDTCAAEFEAQTPYMYSTYEADAMAMVECEARPSDKRKVVILGGGPNRIGQGIEFDYCCCHACFALTDAGYETIMVNCNPETVSTDYDTSDRLYFEPLTIEHVLEILRVEQERGDLHGVIVQFGGQTPLKLANALEAAGIPILGTSPDAIDLAEDRERFQQLLKVLGLRQPHNGIAHSAEEAFEIAHEVGYPVVIRPSYVLGGRAMEIVRSDDQLARYIRDAVVVSGTSPVLIDGYLSGAVEVDVDALCDGEEVHVAGVMEHIEEAGVHSGDSACCLPPHSLSPEMIAELKRQTREMALALGVVGLMNVQFAIKDDDIYVLEVNPRASRTVPFVAKAVGAPIAAIAAQVMAGRKLATFQLPSAEPRHVAVKEAVLPFARFPGVDTLLGPEMRSTGEVMGVDKGFARAFLKSQMAAGVTLPEKGRVFVSVKDADKAVILEAARILERLGFTLVATSGTAAFLNENGVAAERVKKVYEGRPNAVDLMKDGAIALVFNTTDLPQSIKDSASLRATALSMRTPYYTTAAGAMAAARAIANRLEGELQVETLQAYAEA